MTATQRWFGPNARERLGVAQVVTEKLAPAPIVHTGAYTLTATDAGQVLEFNSATAVTVTVPASVFTAGQVVTIVQTGAGQVTVGTAAAVTVNSPTATLKTSAQWGTVAIRFRSTNVAVLSGHIA